MHNPPPGKRFYGSITVSERGQIVIPAEARRDLNIEVGDKLLVFGDLDHNAIGIIKASVLISSMTDFLSMVQETQDSDENKPEEE